MEIGKLGPLRKPARGRIAALCAAASLAAAVLTGCGPTSPPPIAAPDHDKDAPTPPAKIGKFTNSPPPEGQQPMLGNAEFTFAVQADGLPAEEAQVAFQGDYSNDAEEKMVWQSLKGLRPRFTFSGRPITPEGARNYKQGLDTKTGAIITSWIQEGVGDVQVTTMGRGLHYTIALRVEPDKAGTLEGGEMKFVNTGQPPGPRYTGMTFHYHPGDQHKVAVDCAPDEPGEVVLDGKYTHKNSTPTKPQAPEIKLDGPAEDQAAIESLVFQVTAYSTGLGPFGLTNSRYYGHIFWDADAWIFPALALLAPDSARPIPDYRLSTRRGAEENYKAWLKAGRPIGNKGRMLGSEYAPTALKFGWESAKTGREVAPGESRHQEHVSGTVVRGLETASALGMADRGMVDSVGRLVAAYYLSRMEWGEKALEMKAVMSPDEYHIGDNDLYTNMLAQHILSRYAEQTKPLRVHLPRDEKGRFLTYDGDEGRAYQQAAALLTVYPLQNPEAEKQAPEMLDRFASKVVKNGPAMSDSLHALIRARFGDPDQAYAEWRSAYERYAKPPFGYISERPTTHQTVFVTGAAGFLNTVLYGFAGLRVAEKPWPDAEWKMPLEDGWWISGRGNLPSTWKSLTVSRFVILGKPYSLTVTHEGSTIKPL